MLRNSEDEVVLSTLDPSGDRMLPFRVLESPKEVPVVLMLKCRENEVGMLTARRQIQT